MCNEERLAMIRDGVVKIPEAMRRLHVSRSRLYELFEQNKLARLKLGKFTLIPVSSIEQLLAECIVSAPALNRN